MDDDDTICYATRAKRSKPYSESQDLYLFCDDDSKSEHLHDFTTFNSDVSVNVRATQMSDTNLLGKLAGGDLMVLEAKYHFTCLTKYRNQYWSHIRSGASLNNLHVNTAQKRAKAMALANIVSFIENSLKEGVYVFTLSEVHKTYQDCLLNLGVDVQINKSRLKTELLEHFQNLAIQEQFDGRSCLLVFPDGMHEVLQATKLQSNYKSETLQIAEIAKNIREDIFAHGSFKFSGSFPRNCQNTSVPYNLKLLIAMILDGTSSNANIDSQECLTIAQLIIYNSKNKVKHSTEPKRS